MVGKPAVLNRFWSYLIFIYNDEARVPTILNLTELRLAVRMRRVFVRPLQTINIW